MILLTFQTIAIVARRNWNENYMFDQMVILLPDDIEMLIKVFLILMNEKVNHVLQQILLILQNILNNTIMSKIV